MFDRRKIISDVLNDLMHLNDVAVWQNHEKRDDIIRELRFMASSLMNAHIEHNILLKAIDAMLQGYTKLAYSLLYSNNKLGTQEEITIDNKFKNQLTNFTGRLSLLNNDIKRRNNNA